MISIKAKISKNELLECLIKMTVDNETFMPDEWSEYDIARLDKIVGFLYHHVLSQTDDRTYERELREIVRRFVVIAPLLEGLTSDMTDAELSGLARRGRKYLKKAGYKKIRG